VGEDDSEAPLATLKSRTLIRLRLQKYLKSSLRCRKIVRLREMMKPAACSDWLMITRGSDGLRFLAVASDPIPPHSKSTKAKRARGLLSVKPVIDSNGY